MEILLTLSLVLNFILIIGIFTYFKIMKKYSYIFDMFKPLSSPKKDEAIVDEKMAKEFFGESIL